jgi:hypothetical protein
MLNQKRKLMGTDLQIISTNVKQQARHPLPLSTRITLEDDNFDCVTQDEHEEDVQLLTDQEEAEDAESDNDVHVQDEEDDPIIISDDDDVI